MVRICTSLFLHKEGLLLLGLRHYKLERLRATVWTTPGGRNSTGEGVLAGLLRETFEETGIADVEVGRYLGTCKGADENDMLYCFGGTTQCEPMLKEPEKFSHWGWFEPSEVPENFINPRALALYRANYFTPYSSE